MSKRPVNSRGDTVYGKDNSYIQNEKKMHLFLYPVMENLLKRECRGKRVLDIGCGPGQWCRMAAEYGAKSVDGFDIQEKMVETAKQATSMFTTVNIRVGDASHMPYENNTFDIAFSIYVTNNLPKDVLSKHYLELFRVLVPGGKAILVNISNSVYQRIYVSDEVDSADVQKKIKQILATFPKHPTQQQIFETFKRFDANLESACFALDKDGSMFCVKDIKQLSIGQDVCVKARFVTFPTYFYDEQYLVDQTVASGLCLDKVENISTEEVRVAHNREYPDATACKNNVEYPTCYMYHLSKPLM